MAFLQENYTEENLNDVQHLDPDAMDMHENECQRSAVLRETLKRYFSNAGFLEWQMNRDGTL